MQSENYVDSFLNISIENLFAPNLELKFGNQWNLLVRCSRLFHVAMLARFADLYLVNRWKNRVTSSN